jgi:hypothetical protein
MVTLIAPGLTRSASVFSHVLLKKFKTDAVSLSKKNAPLSPSHLFKKLTHSARRIRSPASGWHSLPGLFLFSFNSASVTAVKFTSNNR